MIKRKRIAVLATSALLGLTACTPQQTINMTFGNPDAGGSARLEAEAVRVAGCETGHTYNPSAVSPTNDHGLFQINRTYHYTSFQQMTGQPWHMVYDAFWNAVYAKHLYDQKGWQPWTCRWAA